MNRLRNLLCGFLTGYAVVAWICFFALQESWIHAAPDHPEPGRAYVHNEHGSYVYFSQFEATASTLLFLTTVPLFFLGILVAPKKNERWRGPGANWDADDPANRRPLGFAAGVAFAPVMVLLIGPQLIHALNALGFYLSLG